MVTQAKPLILKKFLGYSAKTHRVSIYINHYWTTDIHFNKRWQARLFHYLLNRSVRRIKQDNEVNGTYGGR